MFSPTTKRALGSDPTHHAKRAMVGNHSSSDGISSDDEWSAEELEEEEKDNDNDEESSSYADEVSLDASDLE